MNPTSTHEFTFATPTQRDYLNGGFGDLVAQCSCGAFEYVYSRREGSYWHGLHRAQPVRHPHYLMLGAPMPEGWEEVTEIAEVQPVRVAAARAYTCPACLGSGAVEAFGARSGRFYHFGERAACSECAGSGSVNEWAA